MTQINVKDKQAVDVPVENTVYPKTKSRWLLTAVLCFVTVFLIVGAGLIGFLSGKHMTTSTYEESWATYRNTVTGTPIKQRYILDGDELLIVKPGELSLIFDYGKSQAVIQVDGMKYKATNDCLCLVYDFDTTEKIGLDQLVDLMKNKEIQESGTIKTKKTVLEATGNKMTISDLSKRSQELCHGCVILEAVVKETQDRGSNDMIVGKRYGRSASCESSTTCYPFTLPDGKIRCERFGFHAFGSCPYYGRR